MDYLLPRQNTLPRQSAQPELFVLIPCFNEEYSIGQLVAEVNSSIADATVIVVNDGSTDQTSRIAKNSGATTIDLPINLGVGGAMQTGFIYAKKQNASLAIKIDGDGQHPPDEAIALIEALDQHDADIVIGSRFLEQQKGYQSTLTRRLGIKFLGLICRILTGMIITDPTSGFRAYSQKSIKFFAGNYPDFDYPEPEEIILAHKHGLKIVEVPVEMRARKFGVSTLTPSISCYYMIKVSLAMIFIFLRKLER